MHLKPYLIRVYLGVLALFALNKFLVRPHVLARDYSEAVRTTVLSLPNTIEGIIGVGLAAAMLAVARFRLGIRHGSRASIVSSAAILTLIYVVTQELNLHQLGGHNTYDPKDLVASVLGVVLMSLVLLRYGLLNESGKQEN